MSDTKFVMGARLCITCGAQVKDFPKGTVLQDKPIQILQDRSTFKCVSCGLTDHIKYDQSIKRMTNDGYSYGMFQLNS